LRKERYAMNAEKLRRIYLVSGALAIALLVLSLSPSEGRAVTGSNICGSLGTTYLVNDDDDNDGFTNGEECNGLDNAGSGSFSFPGYLSPNRGDVRTGYLDPAGKDLFLILVRATPTSNSLIPADSPTTIYSNGLPVTVHEITPSDADANRFVTSTQKAAQITEDLNADSDATILGSSQQGTPNNFDGARVFTQRIKNFVLGRCVTGYTCKANPDASGVASVTGIENVTNLYIRNVISHEMGHVSSLTPIKDRRFEWHYAPATGTVMEQSAKYTSNKSSKVVMFYLSTQYTSPDVAGVTLK
jgi:hypothetical protein